MQGRVLRFDSCSKFLAPGFRIGWAALPPLLARKLEMAQFASSLGPTPFSQAPPPHPPPPSLGTGTHFHAPVIIAVSLVVGLHRIGNAVRHCFPACSSVLGAHTRI